MSLVPFVPTPKFEDYQERFKDHFRLERRADGVLLAQAHTLGGSIQLSVENHRALGQLFKTIARHVPPPAGLRSPILWGTEDRLAELFRDSIGEIRSVKKSYVFRYRSAQDFLRYWRRFYGPTLKAFEAVGEDGAKALQADLLYLIAKYNRATDGTMIVPTEYLETVIVKR